MLPHISLQNNTPSYHPAEGRQVFQIRGRGELLLPDSHYRSQFRFCGFQTRFPLLPRTYTQWSEYDQIPEYNLRVVLRKIATASKPRTVLGLQSAY